MSSRPEAWVAIPNELATLMCKKKSEIFFFVSYLRCTEFFGINELFCGVVFMFLCIKLHFGIASFFFFGMCPARPQ